MTKVMGQVHWANSSDTLNAQRLTQVSVYNIENSHVHFLSNFVNSCLTLMINLPMLLDYCN